MLYVVAGLLATAADASACPFCADAAKNSAGAADKDPMQEARGYEYSIYLMGGMPYLIMAGLGLLFYRAVKKAQREAADLSPGAYTPGSPETIG